jgi:hypothetical protein
VSELKTAREMVWESICTQVRGTPTAREIRPNYFISNFIQTFCLYLILSLFYHIFINTVPAIS